MPQKITVQEFYNRLIASGIIGSVGNITFNLNDIAMPINSKDSIGNMIQDWLGVWAHHNNIYLRANPSTQEFPDFYLSDFSNEDNLLEIKSFNYQKVPAFDIANFEAYFRLLLNYPKKLDADYLIFGYTMDNGILTIKDVWLKKIWEICTSETKGEYDLKMQVTHNVVKNIRPLNLKSNRAQPFTSKLDFLNAIQSVLNQYPKTSSSHNNWLNDFRIAYQTATGNELI